MKTLIVLVMLSMAGSAIAAEDLCTLQLQQLSDQSVVSHEAVSGYGPSAAVAQVIAEAKQYQLAGDSNNCGRSGQQALSMIRQSGGGSLSQ